MRRRSWARPCRGKVRYRDLDEAKAALRTLAASTRQRKPVRAYECLGCNGWHVTGQA